MLAPLFPHLQHSPKYLTGFIDMLGTWPYVKWFDLGGRGPPLSFSYQMSSGFIDLPYGFINLCGRGAPSFVSLSFSCPFALLLFDESDQ
jgi:hypothetical protein